MNSINRRTPLFVAVVCGSLFLLTACGTQSSPPPSTTSADNTPNGIFQQTCANCHGENLEGGYGPSLQHIGSVLTKDQILSIIQHGKGDMPSQGYIASADQQKLAEWLSVKK